MLTTEGERAHGLKNLLCQTAELAEKKSIVEGTHTHLGSLCGAKNWSKAAVHNIDTHS